MCHQYTAAVSLKAMWGYDLTDRLGIEVIEEDQALVRLQGRICMEQIWMPSVSPDRNITPGTV